MKLLQTMFIAGVFTSIAGAAFAGGVYTVTLATPVDGTREVIANSIAFRCSGTQCQSVSKADGAGSVITCIELRRALGQVSAYGSADKPFDADRLTRCNAPD